MTADLTEVMASTRGGDAQVLSQAEGANRMSTATTFKAAFAPVIEPSTQAWVDGFAAAGANGAPLYELSPQDARAVLRAVRASVSVELLPAEINGPVIPGGPTTCRPAAQHCRVATTQPPRRAPSPAAGRGLFGGNW
jgi:hypothetical protein